MTHIRVLAVVPQVHPCVLLLLLLQVRVRPQPRLLLVLRLAPLDLWGQRCRRFDL
mgnify:CR=1 FL=1